MSREPNVSYPSSTELAAPTMSATNVRVRGLVRLVAAAWALAVYVAYWLGYLPGGAR